MVYQGPITSGGYGQTSAPATGVQFGSIAKLKDIEADAVVVTDAGAEARE